jgi:flagellar M-ring protein FliF
VNLKFAESPSVIPTEAPKGLLGMFQFTKDDIMYFVELGVMFVLGIIVVFMVVRPLLKRVLAADPVAAIAAALPALPETTAAPTNAQPQLANNATAQMIDVAQVQGQVHAQSVHRVGELADRNPNETASIIRQWLSEPA